MPISGACGFTIKWKCNRHYYSIVPLSTNRCTHFFRLYSTNGKSTWRREGLYTPWRQLVRSIRANFNLYFTVIYKSRRVRYRYLVWSRKLRGKYYKSMAHGITQFSVSMSWILHVVSDVVVLPVLYLFIGLFCAGANRRESSGIWRSSVCVWRCLRPSIQKLCKYL